MHKTIDYNAVAQAGGPFLGLDSDFSLGELHQYDVTPEDVHIDAPLANVLINYRPSGFIADEVWPIVPVTKQSDVIPKIEKAARFRKEETIRAPGSEPKYIHFDATSDQYFARNFALGTYLTREELANADGAWNTRQIRGELVMDVLLLDYEIRVASAVTNTSNVGSYFTPGSLWSDWENSNALKDIQTAIDVCEDLSGYQPNRIVFGKGAWRNARHNKYIRGALVAQGGEMAGMPTMVRPRQVAELFEVEKVLIGGAFQNTAAEDANATLAMVWGNHVLVYYAPPNPARERPSFGYSFRWNVPGLPNLVTRTFPFDDKKGRQDVHIHLFQDEKVIDTTLGVLVQSTY